VPPTSPAQLPAGAIRIPPVTNQHGMVTRAKRGIRLPALYQTATLSPVPRTYRAALANPNWRAAMEAEFSALLSNHTWDLVPQPPGSNVVTGKYSSINSSLRGLLSAIRLAGFYGVSLNVLVLISMKLSARCSSLLQFGQCYLLLFHAPGLFISSM